MASPHSGLLDDVELVRVETKRLTVIIKGKPYHEQYDGLQSYQKMDFHDVMDFSVEGDDIEEVKVFNIENEQMESPTSLRPIFFENRTYQLIVVPKTNEEFSFYHEHPGLRQAIGPHPLGKQKILMGSLQFVNEVGFTFLEIRSQDKLVLGLRLEIFPVKLDYKSDYKQLLEEVNDEIYNLAFHFIRRTYLKARLKLDGEPSKAEYYRLITYHFEQFMKAIERIEQQPHHELQTTYEKARGDQLRKQDSFTRSYLRKRPHLFVNVKSGIQINGVNKLPYKGLRIRKQMTYDTLENRYVKWMMKRLIHKLIDLKKHIIENDERWNEPSDPNLIQKLNRMITRLESRVNNSFWSKIGKLTRSVMSLVMQMAPGYRDAFQLFLIVSKGLTLQGGIYRMSVKDIAVLYEYWTFLKFGQILGKKYEMISQDIVRVNKDGLFVSLQYNQRAKRVFRHPVTKEKITLIYQDRHDDLPTTSQIPDTMLRIEKKGKDYTFNYIFDAKYRIDYAQKGSSYWRQYESPGPMVEDINTMHRYRDSIVSFYDGPYERTSFGAYVLFPWNQEYEYQHHHFYKSIDQVNIGGLPLLPNATTLVERFVERLIDKSPEEIHQDGILPKGALEEWQSSELEKVMVGRVATEEDYRLFIQEKHYAIQMDSLRQGWQEVKYVALYAKKDVGSANGVTMYGEISDVTIEKEQVLFHVKHWATLRTVIKPVNYGIANYIVTDIETLEVATELPQLFMKTKEEKVLWQMLRRVPDRIKIDLDAVNMDEASEIKEYQIKDIKIKIDEMENQLSFIKNDEKRILDLEMLEKNPSAVFKELMKLM